MKKTLKRKVKNVVKGSFVVAIPALLLKAALDSIIIGGSEWLTVWLMLLLTFVLFSVVGISIYIVTEF